MYSSSSVTNVSQETHPEMFLEPVDAGIERVMNLLPKADSIRRHGHEFVTRFHLRRVGKQEFSGVLLRRGEVVRKL